jgi:hypothetical protein
VNFLPVAEKRRKTGANAPVRYPSGHFSPVLKSILGRFDFVNFRGISPVSAFSSHGRKISKKNASSTFTAEQRNESFRGGTSASLPEADPSAYIHSRSRNRSMNVKNPSIAIPDSITNKKEPA